MILQLCQRVHSNSTIHPKNIPCRCELFNCSFGSEEEIYVPVAALVHVSLNESKRREKIDDDNSVRNDKYITNVTMERREYYSTGRIENKVVLSDLILVCNKFLRKLSKDVTLRYR
jgi:hypothetical protein